MVRTAGTAIKTVGGKSSKAIAISGGKTGSHAASPSGSSRKSTGGNKLVTRPIPDWQKSISSFCTPKNKEEVPVNADAAPSTEAEAATKPLEAPDCQKPVTDFTESDPAAEKEQVDEEKLEQEEKVVEEEKAVEKDNVPEENVVISKKNTTVLKKSGQIADKKSETSEKKGKKEENKEKLEEKQKVAEKDEIPEENVLISKNNTPGTKKSARIAEKKAEKKVQVAEKDDKSPPSASKRKHVVEIDDEQPCCSSSLFKNREYNKENVSKNGQIDYNGLSEGKEVNKEKEVKTPRIGPTTRNPDRRDDIVYDYSKLEQYEKEVSRPFTSSAF